MEKKECLLSVKNLNIGFEDKKTQQKVVTDFNLTIGFGECVGLVGESGSGKSLSALAIAGLLKKRKNVIADGEIAFAGHSDFLSLEENELCKLRGTDIGMIFQEPMSSLNPVYRIGDQMLEMIRTHHREIPKKEALKQCIEMLSRVGIPSPEQRIKEFPHQMSGGMRQRVMIAMALLCQPKLLIADEPTTALDVTIQAQILRILKKLAEESDTSVILITHDMGVVAEMADHVMVMYAGKSVEYGTAEDIFDHPMHPYTVGLLKSIPKLGSGQEDHLFTIEGTVPGLDEMPAGCRFSTRCPYATEQCKKEDPGMQGEAGHFVRCFRFMDPEIQDSREVE